MILLIIACAFNQSKMKLRSSRVTELDCCSLDASGWINAAAMETMVSLDSMKLIALKWL